ncbi:Zn-ribbon domain-containing OB-fold protein [Chloroflexota bacterium]
MSEKTPEREQIPVREGLFVLPSAPAEKPYLVGSKCRSCGEVAFPKRHHCRRCTSADLEDVTLSRTAKLHSFTTVRVKIPDAKVKSPFLVGFVELPEGERVRTLLTDCDAASLKIGDEMELVIDVVYQDESGTDVLGWKFKPVRERQ